MSAVTPPKITLELTGDETEVIEQALDAYAAYIDGDGRGEADFPPPAALDHDQLPAPLRPVARKLTDAWREVDPVINSRLCRR